MIKGFFKCNCGHGGLYVENDEFGTSFAHFEYNVSRPWANRLRLAWKCLLGKPYADMVLLNDQTLADLVDLLADIQNRDVKGA